MTLDVNRGRKTTMQQQQQLQWAHDIEMTLYWCRCDLMASHRRQYDVILKLCAPAGTILAPENLLWCQKYNRAQLFKTNDIVS